MQSWHDCAGCSRTAPMQACHHASHPIMAASAGQRRAGCLHLPERREEACCLPASCARASTLWVISTTEDGCRKPLRASTAGPPTVLNQTPKTRLCPCAARLASLASLASLACTCTRAHGGDRRGDRVTEAVLVSFGFDLRRLQYIVFFRERHARLALHKGTGLGLLDEDNVAIAVGVPHDGRHLCVKCPPTSD